MNQCLRCNKQCGATSLFCDECEVLLQNQELSVLGESARFEKDVSVLATTPHVTVSSVQDEVTAFDGSDDIAKRITAPNPGVQSSRVSQESIYSRQTNRVEQALHRLNDAARRLAAAEPDGQRKPKISRLSPLRDISAEIQRHSTPLPSMPEQKLFSIDDEQSDDLGGNLPDLWPWLNDGDSGEIDAESWSNRTDPLISRRFPDSAEAARIEEEDMRRAAAEGQATFALPVARKHTSHLRVILATLTIIAILALTVDSILVSVNFLETKKTTVKKPVTANITLSPSLTLYPTNVTYGQTTILSLKGFAPSSRVYVTRDGEVPLMLQASGPNEIVNHSVIVVDAKGNAKASIYIESSWNPGFHYIEVEDIKMHYTARTSLHIDNAGPTRPPHLVVDALMIDLGQEPQGANSLRPVTMSNDGSGMITWSASSNRSWLLVAPNQGSFSDSQIISVAGQRANLKPADYSGTVTITSNIGMSVEIQVQMTVLPVLIKGKPILQVTPALLSFTTIDSQPDPASQSLVVSNPGLQPLRWKLSQNAPPVGALMNPNAASGSWLLANHTSGTVAPHTTAMIQITVASSNLLPGTYSSVLLFSADNGAINNPQSVNVSLTILPRCALQISTNTLSFTAISGPGQITPATQTFDMSASSSCSAISAWQGTSSVPWLSINPLSGQLQGITSSTITIAVNITNLQPGTYSGDITLAMISTNNTQTVAVQLIVQSPPPVGEPIIAASPLNINFSLMQGQTTIPSQFLTITNSGASTLYWRVNSTWRADTAWFALLPSNGVILPGQIQRVMIRARAVISGRALDAGQYVASVNLTGIDANGTEVGGSPQTLAVNMNILVPCSLPSPTSNTLAFTATQGGSNPAPQMESFTASGNCVWPVGWSINSNLPSWLSALPASGSFSADGQSATLTIAPATGGLSPGVYKTQITISSTDSSGLPANGSSQTIPITLTVTGYTISGVVNACIDSTCSTSSPLANASLTLKDGSGTSFTVTADANGNYTFTNVALGTATLQASGSNGTTNYTGSTSLSVTGDQLNFTVDTQ